MDDQHSPDDIRCTVLRHLFRQKNKQSACPSCLISHHRYDKVKDHCERINGDEIHQGLIAEDFPSFHSAYARAIGWKCPKEELRLPSSRSASFSLDTVIEFKMRASGGSKFDFLLRAAEKSAMGYLCPYELATFKSMQLLRHHWNVDKSQIHKDLASQSTINFMEAFTVVMGRQINDPPLGSHRRGPQSPIECFKIGYIMKEIDTERLVVWYNENKHLPKLCT